jgi:hypothetical protein
MTLRPADYTTPYDHLHVGTPYPAAQYDKGIQHAEQGYTIHISRTGCWSAVRPDELGGTFSYERIGYHACTSDLVRGWIDGGATIVDHREA